MGIEPRLSVHQVREMRPLFESGKWRDITARDPDVREKVLRLIDQATEPPTTESLNALAEKLDEGFPRLRVYPNDKAGDVLRVIADELEREAEDPR